MVAELENPLTSADAGVDQGWGGKVQWEGNQQTVEILLHLVCINTEAIEGQGLFGSGVVVVADSTLIFTDHERPFGPMSFRVGGSGPQPHKVV